MLEYSEERNPWESMEDKLTLIRYISSFLCTEKTLYREILLSGIEPNIWKIVIRNVTLIVVLKRVKFRADSICECRV